MAGKNDKWLMFRNYMIKNLVLRKKILENGLKMQLEQKLKR